MSYYEACLQKCAFYALAGFTGFMCGVLFQQEASIYQLFSLIHSDPYVYYHRQKLYPILSTFTTNHEARLWKKSPGLTDRLRNCIFFQLFDHIPQLLFSKQVTLSTPDLLELVKYGLPSMENLYVHQDYIVSQDLSTNAPKWMCEHLKGNYTKLSSDDDGDALNLRYNDVYVLSCGATRICKAFKREIWRKLEQHVGYVTDKFGSVYVYTGPMYMPHSRPGDSWHLDYNIVDWIPVPTPSHYFKVLIIDPDPQLKECSPYMEGYLIENTSGTGCSLDLTDYLCDVAEIERHTGLRFHEGLQFVVRYEKEKYQI
ncbi:Tengl3, partial [Drosophila busckii]